MAQSARTSNDESVDDFLGCVDYKVADIPSTGLELSLDLQPRSAKSQVSGRIKLKMWLGTREDREDQDEDDNEVDIKEHCAIIRMFTEHTLRCLKKEPLKWDGELPAEALVILHQHAVQGTPETTPTPTPPKLSFSTRVRVSARDRSHTSHPFLQATSQPCRKRCATGWPIPASIWTSPSTIASSTAFWPTSSPPGCPPLSTRKRRFAHSHRSYTPLQLYPHSQRGFSKPKQEQALVSWVGEQKHLSSVAADNTTELLKIPFTPDGGGGTKWLLLQSNLRVSPKLESSAATESHTKLSPFCHRSHLYASLATPFPTVTKLSTKSST